MSGAFAAWGLVLMATTSLHTGALMIGIAILLAAVDASFNTATRIEVGPGSVALNAWLSGVSLTRATR